MNTLSLSLYTYPRPPVPAESLRPCPATQGAGPPGQVEDGGGEGISHSFQHGSSSSLGPPHGGLLVVVVAPLLLPLLPLLMGCGVMWPQQQPRSSV